MESQVKICSTQMAPCSFSNVIQVSRKSKIDFKRLYLHPCWAVEQLQRRRFELGSYSEDFSSQKGENNNLFKSVLGRGASVDLD